MLRMLLMARKGSKAWLSSRLRARSGLFKMAYELSDPLWRSRGSYCLLPCQKTLLFYPPFGPFCPRLLPLSSQSSQPHYRSQIQFLTLASSSDAPVSNLSSQLAELTALLDAAKSRKEMLKERVHALEGNVWVDGGVSRLSWTELNKLKRWSWRELKWMSRLELVSCAWMVVDLWQQPVSRAMLFMDTNLPVITV